MSAYPNTTISMFCLCKYFVTTGFYPPSNDREYTEDFPASDTDFLTELCHDWEASAELPKDSSTRQVIVRIGVVLGKEGGVLQQAIWPFWFGVGGRWNLYVD